jgi:hypothetical protein
MRGDAITVNANPSHKSKDPHVYATFWKAFTTIEMNGRLPAYCFKA